jgi:small subunit ribosomal protein S20
LPNIKSASKRLRQNQKRRDRNRTVRSEIRTRTKSLLQTESAGEAEEAYRKVASMLDAAARKGIVSKQAAARRKSRLSRYVRGLSD